MVYIVLDVKCSKKKDDKSFTIFSSSHLSSFKIYKFGTHGYAAFTALKYEQT